MLDVPLNVGTEALVVNARGVNERFEYDGSPTERVFAQRRQRGNGDTVLRDNERLTAVQSAHYLAALIAEFALGKFAREGHWHSLAPGAAPVEAAYNREWC